MSERSEVAAKLRDKDHVKYQPVLSNGQRVYSPWGVLQAIIGASSNHERQMYARLADLIDPTCDIESGVEYKDSKMRNVGWYHLSCGHYIDWTDMDAPAYCPYCGYRITGGNIDAGGDVHVETLDD